MACDPSLRSCFARRGTIACAIVALVVLSTVAQASDPVTFYGFDPSVYSPEARAGLEEILAGHVFNFAVPAKTARMLVRAQGGFQKQAGFEPGSQDAIFYASGRYPSPPDRAVGRVPTSAWARARSSGTARRWSTLTASPATPAW